MTKFEVGDICRLVINARKQTHGETRFEVTEVGPGTRVLIAEIKHDGTRCVAQRYDATLLWREPKGYRMIVSITTEDGEVLERFVAIRPANTINRAASYLRDHVEKNCAVEELENVR